MITNLTHLCYGDCDDVMQIEHVDTTKECMSFTIRDGRDKQVTVTLHDTVARQLVDYIEQSREDYRNTHCSECDAEAEVLEDTVRDEVHYVQICDECGHKREV